MPDIDTIQDKMDDAVYGIGPGDFDIPAPVEGTADGSDYLDLEVTYIQETDLLLLPGSDDHCFAHQARVARRNRPNRRALSPSTRKRR